jgi:hypothetical protein
MKKCKTCSVEFEPKHPTRGHEQLYCSSKCRSEAYKQRVNERQKVQSAHIPPGSENEGGGYNRQSGMGVYGYSSPFNNSLLELVEKRSEAQVDSIKYQLKCEQLEKENQALLIRVNQLEAELDEIDSEDEKEPEGFGAVMSGVMDQFKKDPVNTVKFGIDIIQGLFNKPTNNAKATAPKV